MIYYFYRGEEKNFGDELNHYLLPKILPNFFDGSDDDLFLGIGSILFDSHPKEPRKIVLGSGYGGYTSKPVLDDKWHIFGVRGPRTAAALGLDKSLVIADLAAMLFRDRPRYPVKRHKVSFMPHFQSLARGNWQAAAAEAGVNFIDPRAAVDDVLDNIAASELVLAEAMHGAIVADALRVPWTALLPLDPAHRFKWHDWAEALDVTLSPQAIASSSLFEWSENVRIAGKTLKRFTRHVEQPLRAIGAGHFATRAAESLIAASRIDPQLSPDTSIERAVSRFEEAIAVIRRDFSGGAVVNGGKSLFQGPPAVV